MRATSFSAGSSGAGFYTQQAGAGSFLKWYARKTGAPASWVECAKLQNSLTAPYFDIPKAGNLIPIAARSLGDVSNFWGSAWIDSLQISTDIDLEHAASPIIHFDHNGAGATDKLEYDKANNRVLFYVGGAVVGYVDAAGFNNGAP